MLLGLSGPLDSRRLGGQNGQVVVVAECVLQVEQVVLHLGAALLDQRGELGRLLANHFLCVCFRCRMGEFSGSKGVDWNCLLLVWFVIKRKESSSGTLKYVSGLDSDTSARVCLAIDTRFFCLIITNLHTLMIFLITQQQKKRGGINCDH